MDNIRNEKCVLYEGVVIDEVWIDMLWLINVRKS